MRRYVRRMLEIRSDTKFYGRKFIREKIIGETSLHRRVILQIIQNKWILLMVAGFF
jgi:hypothetical protein